MLTSHQCAYGHFHNSGLSFVRQGKEACWYDVLLLPAVFTGVLASMSVRRCASHQLCWRGGGGGG